MLKKIRKALLIKIFLSILEIIMVSVIIIVIFSTALKNNHNVFGYNFFIVKTGSMQGTLEIGDLIVTKKTSKDKLKVYDVISFISSDPEIIGEVNTHRIIHIEDSIYYTQGDANLHPDEEAVNFEDILGIMLWKSTIAGKILTGLSKPVNMFLFIILPTVILIFLELYSKKYNLLKITKKKKKKLIFESDDEILKSLLLPESTCYPGNLHEEAINDDESRINDNPEISADISINKIKKDIYLDNLAKYYIDYTDSKK